MEKIPSEPQRCPRWRAKLWRCCPAPYAAAAGQRASSTVHHKTNDRD
jgi:hypothetical protein